MVQKVNSDIEVNKPAYIYYLMSKSGQCSPTSDTVDSGTGSDLETTSNSNGSTYNSNGSPYNSNASTYNLSNKYSAIGEQIRAFSGLSVEPQHRNKSHSTDSYTDSEESESSLSCDSLNELLRLKNGSTTTLIRSTPFSSSGIASPLDEADAMVFCSDENNVTKISCLPTSLLRDIRDRPGSTAPAVDTTNHPLHGHGHDKPDADEQAFDNGQTYAEDGGAAVSMQSHADDVSDNSSASYSNEPFHLHRPHRSDSSEYDCVYSPEPTTARCSPTYSDATDRTNVYENDKYIAFHINEYASTDEVREDAEQLARNRDDDTFAGYRDVKAQAPVANIFSSKGTIRGVKNRVRNGIATFLQMQQTNVKVSWGEGIKNKMFGSFY